MNWNRSIIRWAAITAVLLALSAASFAQVFISVRIGPPPLPVYAQPLCPGPGFFWTPGYWAWNDDGGYYWVPGTWVLAPVGMLWTPGYWGWGGGLYLWHPGYWGPHVGFYGGINYGFGYTGVGFYGGEWRGRNFYYNRSVTNVSVTNVTNVYNKTVVVNNTTVNNVSYNGGTGGVKRQPTPQEMAAEHERHEAPLSTQTQHQQMASQNRENFARVNQGRPAVAATARPADFSSRSAIPARAAGGAYHAPTMSPKEARGPAVPANRPFTPANSNNANRTVGGSNPNPQDRSNGGFRPFTPPNNNSRVTGGSSASPAQGKSNEGYKPFTPPNNNQSNRNNQGNGPKNNQPNYPKNNQPNYPKNIQPAPQPHYSQPAPQPRHESAPPPQPRHESAPPARPQHESQPPHQNPQREEKHPNKGR
jgi:hypothetical protein